MNVEALAKQLQITNVATMNKAKELQRFAGSKIAPWGLGQGEICKTAICLELACTTTNPGRVVDRAEFVRFSCSAAKVYTNTFNTLQKVLEVRSPVTLQDLVVRYGCAPIRIMVSETLKKYKERFLESLPPAQRTAADFSRPVFLAVAFYLVAKKKKCQLCANHQIPFHVLPKWVLITNADFKLISASMYELCFDTLGIEKTKEKASNRKTNTDVLDAHRRKKARKQKESEDEDSDADDTAVSRSKYDQELALVMPANMQTKYEEGLALVLPVSMHVGGEEKAEDGGMNLEVEVVLPACWRDVKLDVLINPEDNRVVFF
eukprot:gene26704-4273_t